MLTQETQSLPMFYHPAMNFDLVYFSSVPVTNFSRKLIWQALILTRKSELRGFPGCKIREIKFEQVNFCVTFRQTKKNILKLGPSMDM